MRDDTDEIIRGLNDKIESVLDDLSPGWVSFRNKAHLTAKGPKDLGSFQVNLSGQYRGSWRRFSRDIGGNCIKLVAYLRSGSEAPSTEDFRDAFKWARAFLGMAELPELSEEERHRRAQMEARRKREQEQSVERERQKRLRKAETAAGLWELCRPISGTLAEVYLNGRGIPTPPQGWPECLGFLADAEHQPSAEWQEGRKVRAGPVMPALVGRVQSASGETVGVWQVFLTSEGRKASIEPAKVGFGAVGGGAIRLGGNAPHIGAAEGMETALAAWTLEGYRIPVWSMMSTSGLIGFEPPAFIERIRIFPDGDLHREDPKHPDLVIEPPGMEAAKKMKALMEGAEIPTTIQEPPYDADFLDVLNRVMA